MTSNCVPKKIRKLCDHEKRSYLPHVEVSPERKAATKKIEWSGQVELEETLHGFFIVVRLITQCSQ